ERVRLEVDILRDAYPEAEPTGDASPIDEPEDNALDAEEGGSSASKEEADPSSSSGAASQGACVLAALVLAVLFAAPPAGAQDTPVFTRLGGGLLGVGNADVAAADIDGDGLRDVVITGDDAQDRPTTTLYLSDGTGGFDDARAGLPAAQGGAVSMADIDGNGTIDLVLTGRDANGDGLTRVLLNDGTGRFTDAGASLPPVQGESLLDDFNADGAADLVLTGTDVNGDPTATLYLGDGTGGFTDVGASLMGVYEGALSAGDFNEDGDLDLLVSGLDDTFAPVAALYLGDGTGGFTVANAGLTPVSGSASAGDLNGDGHLDLVLTGDDPQFDPVTILYWGDGTGSFTEAGAGLANVEGGASAVTDLDGDGTLDVLVSGLDAGRDEYILLYRGDGTGGFTESAVTIDVGQGRLAVGDVDGSGLPDIVHVGRGNATLYLNDGTGGFAETPTSRLDLVDLDESAAATGDFNDDGRLDVVVAGFDSQPQRTTRLYLNHGAGAFSLANAGLPAIGDATLAVGDFDEDGALDLVLTGSDASGTPIARLALGDGAGGFTDASAGLTDVLGGSASVADFDDDEHLDLLLTGRDAGFNEITTLYLGDGAGGVAPAGAGLPGVVDGSSSVGDFDGDGHLDLVLTGQDAGFNERAALYLGDGAGGFTDAGASLTGVRRSASSVGDFDEDGHLDLVLSGEDASGDNVSTLYLGDGTGGFAPAGAGLTAVSSSGSAAADFDGDGALDLLLTGEESRETATLYRGDGTGGFTATQAGLLGVEGGAAAGDLDGDAAPDLVLTGSDGLARPTTTFYENLTVPAAPVASYARTLSGPGPHAFDPLGATLEVAGHQVPVNVAAARFDTPPDAAGSISDATVSVYRYVVRAATGHDLGDAITLRLDVGALPGVTAPSDVTAYVRRGVGAGAFTEAPTTYDAGADALVAELPFLGEIAFGSDANALPVELTAFTARRDGDAIRLAWTTASETNNAGFEVQRRRSGNEDADAWEPLGFVEGHGTTTEAQTYRFTDRDLPYAAPGAVYRLRQVDTDGTETLSEA
ncbi:MAG: hypothetical protein GVY27_11190, partial [Deinococcus-Thermus bacterium]|nr:hypothetical protein [Deinococcota bacterium]